MNGNFLSRMISILFTLCVVSPFTYSLDEECQQILKLLHERSEALSKISYTHFNEGFTLPKFLNANDAKKYAEPEIKRRFRDQLNEDSYKKALNSSVIQLLEGSFSRGESLCTIFDSKNYMSLGIGSAMEPIQYYLVQKEYYADYDIEHNSVTINENKNKSRSYMPLFTFEQIYEKFNDPSITIECDHSDKRNNKILFTEEDSTFTIVMDTQNEAIPKRIINEKKTFAMVTEYYDFIIVNNISIPTWITERQFGFNSIYNTKYLERVWSYKLNDIKFIQDMTLHNLDFEMPEGTVIHDNRTSKTQQAVSKGENTSDSISFKEWFNEIDKNLHPIEKR